VRHVAVAALALAAGLGFGAHPGAPKPAAHADRRGPGAVLLQVYPPAGPTAAVTAWTLYAAGGGTASVSASEDPTVPARACGVGALDRLEVQASLAAVPVGSPVETTFYRDGLPVSTALWPGPLTGTRSFPLAGPLVPGLFTFTLSQGGRLLATGSLSVSPDPCPAAPTLRVLGWRLSDGHGRPIRVGPGAAVLWCPDETLRRMDVAVAFQGVPPGATGTVAFAYDGAHVTSYAVRFPRGAGAQRGVHDYPLTVLEGLAPGTYTFVLTVQGVWGTSDTVTLAAPAPGTGCPGHT
jgi:hypothetical protein